VSEPLLSPFEADLVDAYLRRDGDGAESGGPSTDDSVALIRHALFEEPAKLEALDEMPAREELPGSAELVHRAQSAVLYSERGHGKSSVALVLGLSVAARGERVFYWDRENGGALTRARVEAILDTYPDWGDPLEDGRFVCRHYPRLDPHWRPEAFAAALDGFGLVVYDSLREAIAQLGGDPNSAADISRWASLCVTPLLATGASVLVLDNIGHEAQDRPRGSSSKLDLIPQAYKVTCTAPFSQAQLGSLELACTRSRSGDVGRHWTMKLGGGVFELPHSLDENPDERATRERRTKREAFRRTCLRELEEESPLGRDPLLKRVRSRGVEGGEKKLRGWLAEDASDPSVPFSHGPDGYCPGRADTPRTKTPGQTPPDRPRISLRDTASNSERPGGPCDDPRNVLRADGADRWWLALLAVRPLRDAGGGAGTPALARGAVVIDGQLDLFAETVNGDAPAVRMNRDEAGLVHGTPAGAERLLAAMVKRGLPQSDLRVAAALCLALDERPVG
jgi:AAA domain